MTGTPAARAGGWHRRGLSSRKGVVRTAEQEQGRQARQACSRQRRGIRMAGIAGTGQDSRASRRPIAHRPACPGRSARTPYPCWHPAWGKTGSGRPRADPRRSRAISATARARCSRRLPRPRRTGAAPLPRQLLAMPMRPFQRGVGGVHRRGKGMVGRERIIHRQHDRARIRQQLGHHGRAIHGAATRRHRRGNAPPAAWPRPAHAVRRKRTRCGGMTSTDGGEDEESAAVARRPPRGDIGMTGHGNQPVPREVRRGVSRMMQA